MVEYTQPKYNFAGGYRDAGDDGTQTLSCSKYEAR